MLRFAKPNGDPFDPDYMGDIHVVDSGNSRIAICCCSKNNTLEDLTDSIKITVRAVPEDWDCWDIVIRLNSLQEVCVLQKTISSAWHSLSLLETMVAYYQED